MKIKKRNVNALVECAIMVALASVLSLPILPGLPFGGTVTLCGMLPIIIAGYRHGKKWGLISGFVFGLLQLLVLGGLADLKGIGLGAVVGSVVLDFLVAFSVLGLADLFKNRLRKPPASLAAGTAAVILMRYAAHIVSGVIFFGTWAEWFFTDGAGVAYGDFILSHFSGLGLYTVYSVIYNGLYMIPELILETAAALLIAPLLAKIPVRE